MLGVVAWMRPQRILLLHKKRPQEETKHTMNHYGDNRSVGTYPNQNLLVRVL
jgi:hypothetical protein